MAITKMRGSPIRIYHSRQATLHTALRTNGSKAFAREKSDFVFLSPYAPQYRFTPDSYEIYNGVLPRPQLPRTRTGLHVNRVGFPMPLGSALRTQAQSATTVAHTMLPPSTHPKLGVQSRHKEFQRYAL